MTKRQNTPVEIEIDQGYERRVMALEAAPHGHVTDYAIEPARPERRPQPPASWVPGPTQTARVQRVQPAQIMRAVETLQQPVQRVDDGETVSERSTPVQRALSVGIVAGMFVIVALIVCFAFWLAGAPDSVTYIMFGAAVVLATLLVYFDSNKHSPTGVERFKASQYTKIRLAEIDSDEAVSMAKIQLLRDMAKELEQ
ncbi:hypothetical protein E6Q11_02735 [Candidatus Dojkabacteria bacterium]|uniref:Uncharacterized protein n=1 Tax=Candidatus Dojkabacteria bacterium TaxID=2099670 RepID=A0A5C7J7J6_9BACT|nr:MAG: hypothetical protein E6Q11_02735 [Candidatus Dojkabacteria bacterium]